MSAAAAGDGSAAAAVSSFLRQDSGATAEQPAVASGDPARRRWRRLEHLVLVREVEGRKEEESEEG